MTRSLSPSMEIEDNIMIPIVAVDTAMRDRKKGK
jgi:hypothetical protein